MNYNSIIGRTLKVCPALGSDIKYQICNENQFIYVFLPDLASNASQAAGVFRLGSVGSVGSGSGGSGGGGRLLQ